jgi:zinc D-Ala-D-Ala carboxypeptidase
MDNDIPEALREHSPVTRPGATGRLRMRFILLGVGGLLLLGATWLLFRWFVGTGIAPEAIAPLPATPKPPRISPSSSPDNLLGHLAYPEAPAMDLQSVTSDGKIKLRRAAAPEFTKMVAAAQADGTILVPLSGFRSIQAQNHLFFDIKAERGQVPTERAQVSAPPGYSEHHTGYAIDIGDGSQPGTHLQTKFQNTPAFRWLKANAAYYSFELSFPANNPQGVSYEPWHWRFVGDQNSLKTFYQARQRSQPRLNPTQP